MYLFRAFLIGVIVFSFCGGLRSQVGRDTGFWNWTEPAEHHKAVVLIRVQLPDSFDPIFGRLAVSSSGAGGVISGGLVVTAAHVVEGSKTIDVLFFDGRKASATIHYINCEQDVAILRCEIPDGIPALEVAACDPIEGEAVEVCGFGGTTDVKEIRHFSSVVSVSSARFIGLNSYCITGDSGGVILNKKNQVVGVVSGGMVWSACKCVLVGERTISVTWPIRCGSVTSIRGGLK